LSVTFELKKTRIINEYVLHCVPIVCHTSAFPRNLLLNYKIQYKIQSMSKGLKQDIWVNAHEMHESL